MKNNLLFITRAYGEHAGGMERLSFELIQAIQKYSEGEVEVLANKTKKGTSLFSARLSSMIFAITVIPPALAIAKNADTIHLGDPVLSFVGWLIQKIYKKPIAITVHGLDITYTNPIYKLYLKMFFRNFDTYLPISTYAETLLKTHNVKGRIKVVNPGIHDSMYNPRIRQQENNRFTLLTSGRLIKRKGHEWFIRNVLPKLPENIKYIIAGDGPEKEMIEQAIQEMDIRNKVSMLGRVSANTLKKLYNTSDAFIQPNIKTEGDVEGFGIVLLEAALCDMPVFVSNMQGMTDAIHNNKNGYLLEAENTQDWIEKITEHINNPKSNIQARQYTLDTFSWKKQAEEFLLAIAKK